MFEDMIENEIEYQIAYMILETLLEKGVLTHQEVPKRQSNHTNNNYIKNIYTECNQSTDPALAEILQNCELKSFESKRMIYLIVKSLKF